MACTIKDAAYILSAIAGPDPHDNYTSAIPWTEIPKFETFCKDHNGLQGMRIGIPRNAFTQTASNGPEIVAFNASLAGFAAHGAKIIDNANFPNLTEYMTAQSSLVDGVEFEAGIANYFNSLAFNPNNIHSLPDLIKFIENFAAEDYPDRNVNTWLAAVAFNLTTASPAYLQARANDLIAGSDATILGALEKYDLDALIMPSSNSPGYAAIAGYPIVTVSSPKRS